MITPQLHSSRAELHLAARHLTTHRLRLNADLSPESSDIFPGGPPGWLVPGEVGSSNDGLAGV